jgi:uncharacterized membrane protein YgcG
MDAFDDYEDEMFRRLTADRADAIIEGRGRSDDPLATDLSAALEDLRLELLEEPSPDVADRHLAAMVAASRAPSAVEGLVADPAGRGAMSIKPAEFRNPKVARRRLRVAVVGLAACFVLVGGLAAAGALPGPAQDAVADAAELVGFDLPGGSSEQAEEASAFGKEVSETAQSDDLSGCEKGMAVAQVATSKAEEQPDLPADACTNGDDGEGEGTESSGGGSGSGSGGRTESGGGGGGSGGNEQGSGGGSGSGGATEGGGTGGGGGSGGTEQGSGGGSGSGGGGQGAGSGSGSGTGGSGSVEIPAEVPTPPPTP